MGKEASKLTEARLLQEMMLALQPHQKLLRYWRVNTGTANTDKGFIKFGHVGAGDIEGLLSPLGRFFAIEMKKPGGTQRPSQELFQMSAQAMGGLYFLVDSRERIRHTVCRLLELIERDRLLMTKAPQTSEPQLPFS